MKNIFRFGRLKNNETGDLVQVEHLNGEVHSSLKHPQSHGVESKPPAGSETYTVFQDGNPEQGAVLIIAGRAPITLSDGETVVYSSGGATVHCTASGTIELNGAAFGGLIKIADLTTKINALIAELQAHSHTGAGAVNTGPFTPFVRTDYENTDVNHG
jgi:phage gp45-like